MARKSVASVLEAITAFKKKSLTGVLPVYYFYGEDSYTLNAALKTIEEETRPLLSSDFDKEVFYGENKTLNEIIDAALSFPFSSRKKLIVVKEAEKIKDKKLLKDYVQAPADFTTLVFIHNGSITNLTSEPFKTLQEKEFLFEAKELKGKHLVDWLVGHVESRGKKLSQENAQVLLDMVGENRSMLEVQIEKLFLYLNDKYEITIESINEVSSSLKQNNIFDLQNAIGVKDKSNALQIAFNLLDNGTEPVFIIAMLTRYFTGLSKITELKSKNIPDQAAARIVGTHPYYYPSYVKARSLFSDNKLIEVFRALLKADVSVKTTTTDDKTVITLLIAEILQ